MRWILFRSLGSPLAGCVTKPLGPPMQMPVIGHANPASVFCAKLGGKVEIRPEPGGLTGWCQLPDGSVHEEWNLFRRDHKAQ
ncbi:hypothetical protein BD293_4443 [Roseinatronobacter monicus]|uniref:Hemolysin n=2 Tax=Roseinatronobacter monicus TaxID=393481 RepID=A0A543K3W3_9RHOB|nr:hypothetical protein BD293_4443 [Roseinatronobacter monicus]